MNCDECKHLGIPERLCMQGKNVDNVPFQEDELLYRRVNEGLDITKISIDELYKIFPLNQDSYNRSSLSNKKDVLIDEIGNRYPDNSIIEFSVIEVNAINHTLPGNKNSIGSSVRLEVNFTPRDCNFAHAEIFCYKNNERVDNKKLPKSAKTYVRDQLRRLSKQSF